MSILDKVRRREKHEVGYAQNGRGTGPLQGNICPLPARAPRRPRPSHRTKKPDHPNERV